MLEKLLEIMLRKSHGPHHLPRSILVLCDDEQSREIRGTLPEFDAWGVKVPVPREPVVGPKVDGDVRASSPAVHATIDDRVEGKKRA